MYIVISGFKTMERKLSHNKSPRGIHIIFLIKRFNIGNIEDCSASYKYYFLLKSVQK